MVAGIVDPQLEDKAVELGFGQGIGTLLLDGILGGEYEEWLAELHGLASRGDRVFLHGLEQGRLSLGRRAVDFVGEDDVGEQGPADEAKSLAAGVDVLFEHFSAGDVRRHQIWSELDAAKREIECASEGLDECSFGQARYAYQQAVAAGEQGDEQFLDDLLLADDDLADLAVDAVPDLAELSYGLGV